uniref:Fas associated via death domain n=1 Tax=Neovison vison TaxID=452646 RepID=A0A8C7AVI9_NEOVI
MDPFLVLLHSVSTGLSDDELTELRFLCRGRVGKRKLESVRCGLDLFAVLLEQNDALGIWGYSSPNVSPKPLVNPFLLPPDLRAAFDIVCDNVGRDWRRLARHLNVSDTKIDAIQEKYPRNLTEQVRESLRVWKSAQREDATVSHLVRALRACQLNLVADLVLEDQQARENESQTASSREPHMSWPPCPAKLQTSLGVPARL